MLTVPSFPLPSNVNCPLFPIPFKQGLSCMGQSKGTGYLGVLRGLGLW